MPFACGFACRRRDGAMLIHSIVRVVDLMFIVGILGSGLVVVLTTIEDIREFLLREEKENEARG
jgi:hypothetical protein